MQANSFNLSIIVPMYNEGENVTLFYEKITEVWRVIIIPTI